MVGRLTEVVMSPTFIRRAAFIHSDMAISGGLLDPLGVGVYHGAQCLVDVPCMNELWSSRSRCGCVISKEMKAHRDHADYLFFDLFIAVSFFVYRVARFLFDSQCQPSCA